MNPPPEGDITRLLQDPSVGSDERSKYLVEALYGQLHSTAVRLLAGERANHTLGATALIHEAYLKLTGDRDLPWANRAHFYVAAAEAMRRVLVDHARSRGRQKRGGGRAPLALRDVLELADRDSADILRFDDALRRFQEVAPDAAAVVQLRFLAGLTVEQTAAALEMSTSTVDRRWAFARAWLYRELSGDGDEASDARGI
ncbi:MAG: ECF-type sigma factor [Planctomycetota bacterium]